MGKKKSKREIVYIIQERREEEKPFQIKFNLALEREQIDKIIDLIWKTLAIKEIDASNSDVDAIAQNYIDGDYY